MDVINTRKRMEEDLSLLKNMIYRMSGLAAESIERAVWALKNNDAEMAQKVIADGDVIDDLEEKLDAACMEFAARYQPLGEDLRVVVSIMHIAVDLERIGDYGENIAKVTLSLCKLRGCLWAADGRSPRSICGRALPTQRGLVASRCCARSPRWW